jgi:hypothetical protein
MWRCVDLVWTDVSEERIAPTFRVEKSASEKSAWTGGCSLHVGSHKICTAPHSRRRHSSKSKLCYDRRSVGQSILKWSPIWGPKPNVYYCQTVAGSLTWGALSDDKTGLSFTIAAGPRQRSHSRVRVSRDSWQYVTVSDWRLPKSGGRGTRIYIRNRAAHLHPRALGSFSSPPTTRRATVEVFEPASTRACEQPVDEPCPYPKPLYNIWLLPQFPFHRASG